MGNESRVGQLAQALNEGYMAFAATDSFIRHPYAADALDRIETAHQGPSLVPTQPIFRTDGTAHFFQVLHALRTITNKPDYRETYDRVWLGGAVLTLGDELARNGYFDKAPDLEFVRHLRNGVAHGNRFHFSPKEPRLPAHFTGPAERLLPDGVTATPAGDVHTFEITRSLQGTTLLFDFMGPGDICDLLIFVSWRLIRIGNGDPPHPLWPQR
jgi:hypothetical protein